MKKIFVAIMAMAAVTACATDDVVRQNYDNAIEFNTFVGNTTKVATDNSYSNTAGNLEQFQVWGTIAMTGTTNYANIFDGVVVNKGGSGVGTTWTYGVEYTQYWIPGNTYSFVGIVDGNEGNNSVEEGAYNMPTHINVDMAQQSDVLYATAGKDYVQGGAIETVHLQFAHLLAKAKFTVKNTMSVASGYSYTVEDIRIVNADATGRYDIQAAEWTPGTGVYTADFGKVTADHATAKDLGFGAKEESDLELLLLPHAGKKLAIEVDYTLYRSGVKIQQFVGTTAKQVSATLDIEKGRAYNFVLELGNPGEVITFKAEVDEWIPEGGQDTPVYEGQTVYVASATELAAALDDANTSAVVLTDDVELTGTITRAGGDSYAAIDKSFVIDGQGHTLTYNGSNRAIDITNSVANATLAVTIKNLKLNCTASYVERGINYNANGTLTLENVETIGTAPTYAVNLPGKADNAVVSIKDCKIVGNIALNVWGENMKIDVVDSELSNYDATEVENYTTVKLNNDGTTSADGTVINIKGGKVLAYDEKGEPSYVTSNATAYGQINISETTEVVGTVFRQVALVTYDNTDCYYGVGTLAGAIAQCIKTNGASVRLTDDIVLEEPLTIKAGESVVLDLCGHTVSAVDSANGSYGLITNQGNLNVVGPGKLQLTATVNRGWNAYSSVISNTVGGNLVVEGGVVIEHLGGTDMAYGIDNLTNGKGTLAIVTVKDATVKSPYRAIRQFLNGTEATNELYVKAGAVVEGANKSIWMQDPSANANTGKLVVEAGAQLKGDVYLYVCAGSTAWPVEVSIASAALVGESTVLTGNVPAEYEVVEENGVWTVNYLEGVVFVTTAEELASVVKAATSDIVVAFANDLEGKIVLCEVPGVNVTVLGKNKKYTGYMHIYGNGGGNDRSLTIKGVNFDGTGLGSNEGCIYTTLDIPGYANHSYASNVTVEDCTFTGAGVAAIRQNNGGDSNWTVKGCTVANDMHSFLQLANIEGNGVAVENCKVYSKNGANLNQTCKASFTGCEFDVRGYAVRVGVNDNNPLVTKTFDFTNCTLKSECNDGDAVIVVRKNAVNATLNFVNTELIGTTKISGNTSATTINGLTL